MAAESAARQQREARRAKLQSAGMSGAANSLDALEDEAQARRAALERTHAPGTPEHQAGMQAINNHVQQQQAQIAAKADQLPQIAAQIYQHWGHGVAGNWITGEALKGNEEYSPGAPLSSTHLDVLDQEAKKYGVDPKDLRHHMEMQRLNDWSRASTNYANRQQENLVDRTVRQVSGRGPAEPTRVLPNGSITVNPALGEDQATFDKAIENTYSSPEAKAAARKMWPAYHDHWLNTARDQLETSQTLPGVENYQQWRERNQLEGNLSVKDAKGNVTGFLTPNQTAQRYLDEMKARPGWRKLADNISTSLTAGGGQVVAGLLGAEALAKNSFQSVTGLDVGGQAASEAAAAMARQNQALTQSHELTGTIDGLGGRVVSGVAQAVPGIGAAVATGGTGGAALSFVQGAGSTYNDLYQHHINEGMSPEQAHSAAAGTAIASGAVSAALGKVFSGGANALNNPATREVAKKSFGSAVKSFLKGAADEIPQEVLDSGFTHIASEMNKGRSFKEAATSYAEQFPQSALTAALLGGTLHTAASHHADTHNPPAPNSGSGSGSRKPLSTTVNNGQPPSTPPSGKQPSTTVNNGQPSSTPPSGQPSQTTANNSKPSPTLPPPTTPPKSPEKSQKLIDNVSKMPAPAQQHPQVQADLNQAKSVVVQDAQKVIDNISKIPAQAQQHPKVQEKLAEAKKVVEDHAPKPETQTAPPSAPQVPEGPTSTGADQPQGTSATTHGGTPTVGHVTDTHTGEGDTNATTATANSDGTTSTSTSTTAAGNDTHTASTNAQPNSTGTKIPPSTTSTHEIDLARKITGNLDKVQTKRPLNPREQADYDKARGILDRNAPTQPGDRNTSNPDDLAMAGDADALVPVTPDGEDAHLDAAADAPPAAPPAAAPAQPTNAVGTTIEGPGAIDPNAPTASTGSPALPPSPSPVPTQTTGTSTSTSASQPTGNRSPAVSSTASGTPGKSSSTNNNQQSATSSPANGKSKAKPKNSPTPHAQEASPKKKPLNSPSPKKWKANGGTVDADWTYTDKHGNKVPYPNGYPDFKAGGHVKAEVEIKQKGNHTSDFRDAITANGGTQPPGTTWHHNENGTTMQAVDTEVHARFTHRGGVSINKKGKR